jgi:hypothetical protein
MKQIDFGSYVLKRKDKEHSTITSKFSGETPLEEVVEHIEMFVKACGFSQLEKLEVVYKEPNA